ncbi:hypothetical protein AB4Z43_26880 [Mesorhizobium sp. 2RAF45]|uniref:hypothetical protein n=1 Tax=Mesorhizobium sp. 2RAF45 TaxID=3233001 RepID=UPI003F9479D3
MNGFRQIAISSGSSPDPALNLWNDWHRARHVSLVLCRVQQRVETQTMVNPGIPVLSAGEVKARQATVAASGPGSEYAIAREAEVFAMTEALRFQDAIPKVTALSFAGIVAKLEMIVGADREIGDPTDFPWPHIASVLRDLKAIAGDLPAYRSHALPPAQMLHGIGRRQPSSSRP